MKIVYLLIWTLLTAIICYLLYNMNQHIQLESAKNSTNSEIEVINSVSGSGYTSDENVINNDDTTSDTNSNPESTVTIENNEIAISQSRVLETASIEFNQNDVNLALSPKLELYFDSLALISKTGKVRFTAIGHADKASSSKYNNDEVGLKRAESVQKALISKGVPAEYITIETKGDREPKLDDGTPNAMKKNRRVELFINQNN